MAAQHVSPWLKKRLEPKALKSGRDVQALKDVWKKTEIEQLLGVPCVYIYMYNMYIQIVVYIYIYTYQCMCISVYMIYEYIFFCTYIYICV